MIGAVFEADLQAGIDNSLDKKLDAALAAYDTANENYSATVANILQAFINEVEAQRGNKIPDAVADDLVARARGIIQLLLDQ